MTKIDLVTGFLGSGKTTFIKKYVEYLVAKGLKICILENDFGAINIDMMLLLDAFGESVDIEMVAGGCDADCHKRRFKTKLISMGMKEYDRVIVEPSGLFDIDEFFDSLYDEPLDQWYEIGSVITVIDTEIELPFDETVKTCVMQEMANAGTVLLSKTQNSTKEKIQLLKNYLVNDVNIGLNNEIIFDKPFNNLDESDYERIIKSGYRKNDYNKFNIEETGFSSLFYMENKYSVDKWKKIAESLFKENDCGKIFRIKGFIFEDDNWYEFNSTSLNCNINKIDNGQDVMIIIGYDLKEDLINSIIL